MSRGGPSHELILPWCGLAMVFIRDESAREAIEEACTAEGIGLGGWREVPVRPEALGEEALASMPRVEQLVRHGARGTLGQPAPQLGQRRLEQLERRGLAPWPAHTRH